MLTIGMILQLLQLKASAGSKRQHVHDCSLVRARRLYGYDASEQLYAKLYLYPKCFNLLLNSHVYDLFHVVFICSTLGYHHSLCK